MRIAVPTNDGTSVSDHFGRSSAFLVFEIENGAIKKRDIRPNAAHHAHAEGTCGEHAGKSGAHSHAGILESLAGCDIVICAGMGWRAAEALKAGGITAVITARGGSGEEVVAAYVNGSITAGEGFCQCQH